MVTGVLPLAHGDEATWGGCFKVGVSQGFLGLAQLLWCLWAPSVGGNGPLMAPMATTGGSGDGLGGSGAGGDWPEITLGYWGLARSICHLQHFPVSLPQNNRIWVMVKVWDTFKQLIHPCHSSTIESDTSLSGFASTLALVLW